MKDLSRGMKPDIEYPCTWVFKLFVTDRELLGKVLPEIIPGRDYALADSHSSRRNRYHCMNLEIMVMGDEDRLEVYEKLSACKSILLIL